MKIYLTERDGEKEFFKVSLKQMHY